MTGRRETRVLCVSWRAGAASDSAAGEGMKEVRSKRIVLPVELEDGFALVGSGRGFGYYLGGQTTNSPPAIGETAY